MIVTNKNNNTIINVMITADLILRLYCVVVYCFMIDCILRMLHYIISSILLFYHILVYYTLLYSLQFLCVVLVY